jgi:hypothetical protein
MAVYVRRNGVLVDKETGEKMVYDAWEIAFPTPRVSRFEPMESPVTGKIITSWREREIDMQAAGAIDRRDLPADYEFKRGRKAQFKELEDAKRAESER